MTATFIPNIYPPMPAGASRGTCDPEWRGILRQIYTGDSEAAASLYGHYHGGIREALRRRTGCEDVAEAVFDVLIAAIRRVRCCDLKTRQEFEQAIDDLARDEALIMRGRGVYSELLPEIALHRKGELLNTVLTRLSSLERQIVLSAYLLHQSDAELSASLNVPLKMVESARLKARTLYISIHPVGCRLPC
jgi:DNA-directed RNA polymerase specialized sigma24 family protein